MADYSRLDSDWDSLYRDGSMDRLGWAADKVQFDLGARRRAIAALIGCHIVHHSVRWY